MSARKMKLQDPWSYYELLGKTSPMPYKNPGDPGEKPESQDCILVNIPAYSQKWLALSNTMKLGPAYS